MAVIAPTDMSGPAGTNARLVVKTTMTGGDTFVYQRGSGQILVLDNPTAGALSPTLFGVPPSLTINVPGSRPVDVASYAIGSIAPGAARTIFLDNLYEHLIGTCTINTGVGLVATLFKPV